MSNKSPVHGITATPSPVSRPRTRSSSNAKWELGWEDPDEILKISVFRESKVKKHKGATQLLRNRISRMEQLNLQYTSAARKRFHSPTHSNKSQKFLTLFRKIARSVILLLKCFRLRRKFAVQSRDLTLTHLEQTDDFSVFKTSSISRELQVVLSTPPEHRSLEDLKKVQYYMKATGAHRLLASASTNEDLKNLARYVSYERYENDRVVAQQGRPPTRFYFVITGKLLIVKEYQIESGNISKTVGVLTKGMTTNVEEMEQRGPVETLVLDRDDYFLVHGKSGGAPREFLSRHSLFKQFPFQTVTCHKQLLRLQYFPRGAVIFGGGKEFEWIYIVKSGECSIIRVQTVTDFKTSYSAAHYATGSILGLGKQRRRVKTAAEKLASFQGLKGSKRQPISFRTTRKMTSSGTEFSKFRPSTMPIYTNSSKNEFKLPYKTTTIERQTFPTESQQGDNGVKEISKQKPSHHPSNLPTLGKSKFKVTVDSRKEKSKSAPQRLRQACLELGKLKSGDVLGLEDVSFQVEDLPNIRLISDAGTEIILLNRKFFFRNAPTSLLSLISHQTNSYPCIEKARSDLETLEAWSMYKAALVKTIACHRSTHFANPSRSAII